MSAIIASSCAELDDYMCTRGPAWSVPLLGDVAGFIFYQNVFHRDYLSQW